MKTAFESLKHKTPRRSALAAVALGALLSCACVYHLDIQQGNLIDSDAVEQVEVGMSRSAVQFLLGTPMVADAFHQGRWDYPYYLRRGRAREIDRRWLAVYFDEDRVVRVERDLNFQPRS
jgi:outer membrane protein assembly factor BamE